MFRGKFKTSDDFDTFHRGYKRHKSYRKAWRIVGIMLIAVVLLLAFYFTIGF